MNLTEKILLIIMLVSVVSFSAATYIRHNSVLPQLLALEARADRKDIQRLNAAIHNQKLALERLTVDYGIWQDAYEFLQNRDPGFIDRNFNSVTYSGNDIDLVMFADRSGSPFKLMYYDREAAVFRDAPSGLGAILADQLPAGAAGPETLPVRSGLMASPLGPLLFASIRVLSNASQSDSPGYLLIARRFDASLVAQLSEAIQLPLSMESIQETTGIQQPMQLHSLRRNNRNQISWGLPDVNNSPLIRISLQLPERAFDDAVFSRPLIGSAAIVVLSWGVLILLLGRSLVQPILDITRFLTRVRETEDYQLRLKLERKDELGLLAKECNRLLDFVASQQQQLRLQSRELEKLSFEDSLTGLDNRRALDQQLETSFALSRREQQPLALLMCDVDNFKSYNDLYGHQQGDLALQAVAAALQQALTRRSDIAARFGGEEFAVLLFNVDQAGAEAIAARILENIRALKIEHQHSPVADHLTASIGLAMLTPGMETPEALLTAADQALYRAKACGKNRYTVAMGNPKVDSASAIKNAR